MNFDFEFKFALLTLDGRTPDFFVREALADTSVPVRDEAAKILRELGAEAANANEPTATQKLIERLRIY